MSNVIPLPYERPRREQRAAFDRLMLLADYGMPAFPTPEELEADFLELFGDDPDDVPLLPAWARPTPRTLIEAFGEHCPIEPMPAWTWQLKVRELMVGPVGDFAVGVSLAIFGGGVAWILFGGGA